MSDKKYYLGLDIGTNSVGFCVTDETYNIIKKHKKVTYISEKKEEKNNKPNNKYYGNHLWGARLFDAASSAKDRRTSREARRRFRRRRERILYLQKEFSTERNKVDPYFFDRLNNSAIHIEDRDALLQEHHLLFNEPHFTDVEFFKKYPTIYHLRLARIEHPEQKFDIREVYLALAHMIKYRGNFLFKGTIPESGCDADRILNTFNELDSYLDEKERFCCTNEKASELLKVFQSETRVQDLHDKIQSIFPVEDKHNSFKNQRIYLIAGASRKTDAVFKDSPDIDFDIIDDEIQGVDICLGNADFEEKTLSAISEAIGDNNTKILLSLKKIFARRNIQRIIRGKKSISAAMVAIYNEHNKQLKVLKQLIKRYNPNYYSAFFRHADEIKLSSSQTNNKCSKTYKTYASYIGSTVLKGKRRRFNHDTTTPKELYSTIEYLLPISKIKPNKKGEEQNFKEKRPGDKKELLKIDTLISNDDYLLRQNSSENGVLPYQLNLNERRRIIENQSKYYPFLSNLDSDFSDPKNKCFRIESILKYKIPYYVGPLSPKATHNWVSMNNESHERITPWNFWDIVNQEKTEEAFIDFLKNYCSYLIHEPTLPKQSLVYQRFVLLNEMNTWQRNGIPLSTEDKEYLITNLYLKQRTITKLSTIEKALRIKYKTTDIKITTSGTTKGKGITDDDLHGTLSSWIDFSNEKAFGPELFHSKKIQEIAEITIKDATLFQDKKVKQERLKRFHLSPSQIKYRSNFRYKGWARLSNKLLTGIKISLPNEPYDYSILDLMWKKSLTLEEILKTKEEDNPKNYKYPFLLEIKKENGDDREDIDDILSRLHCSPKMERAIFQTIEIIKELKSTLHIKGFSEYFVETGRFTGEKKRTNSRKIKIENFYKGIEKQLSESDREGFQTLKGQLKEFTNTKLKKKKWYLYFRQLGKSLYTGKPIDFNNFENYDIDHIIPRARVKDDSFTNLVLVEKIRNKDKSNHYPFVNQYVDKEGIEFITFLNKANSKIRPDKKRNRILRTKELSNEEISGFVKSQLTTTDQSVNAVCKILNLIDKKARVVYSRASTVAEFRQLFGLVKSRDANDFHHAQDAYLNIVVGNVYDKEFSDGGVHVIAHKRDYMESLNRSVKYMFHHDERVLNKDTLIWKSKNYIIGKDGEEIEDPNSHGTIDIIRKYFSINDPLITRKMERKPTLLFSQNEIISARNGGAQFPLKQYKPFNSKGFETKYGGYSHLSNPYGMLVKSEGKNKKPIYSIEFVPSVYLGKHYSEIKVKKYLSENKKCKNPEICIKRLRFNTIIEIPCISSTGETGVLRVGLASGKTNGHQMGLINMTEPKIDNKYRCLIKSLSKLAAYDDSLIAESKDKQSSYEKYGMNDIDENPNEKIKRTDLEELFKYITEVLYKKPEFECLPKVSNTLLALETSLEEFKQLSTINQVHCLCSMLKIIQAKSVQQINFKKFADSNSNLTIFENLPKTCGDIVRNNELPSHAKIIQTSATGLTEWVLFEVPEN